MVEMLKVNVGGRISCEAHTEYTLISHHVLCFYKTEPADGEQFLMDEKLGILAFADHLHAQKPITHYRKEKTQKA